MYEDWPEPDRAKDTVRCFAEICEAVEADLQADRREIPLRVPLLERALASALSDQRDRPVLSVWISVVILTIPSAVVVFSSASHLLGLIYLILNYGIFLQRFLVALLHVTEHRSLFRPEWNLLNRVAPLILAPLFGIPSGMYTLHHKEGNRHPWDISSTEPYQRDHLPHFLWYWARHALAAWIEVPLYALQQKRSMLFLECMITEIAYLAAVYFLCRLNSVATIWVFIMPYFISSLALMFGNWSQHIFLHGPACINAYQITYNCVAGKDNQLTFNDGYHIQHHLNSKLHWSELPRRFLDTLEHHSHNKALVFRDIGVFDVGLLVMMGRLETLASHLLLCNEEMAKFPLAERVALLKHRLRPMF